MSGHLGPIEHRGLEVRLGDLASAIVFPPTPDIATVVGSRLRGPRPQPLPIWRSLRRSLLLAATLALLVVGGALAIGFGLELLHIRFGPVPTIAPSPSAAAAGVSASPSTSPEPLGSSLLLGRPLVLQDASAAAAFHVLVPAALGPPDIVYVGGPALRGQVALVYAPRGDLPLSGLLGGAGLLITENRGEADDGLAAKLVDAGLATVEPMEVNGASGAWISGGPHIFWYLAPDGSFIQDSRRYVGDTLAWERDGVLYRIEGAITKERALEIAASMR